MPWTSAHSQEKPSVVSLDVTEAYLEDVLKVLSQQSGLNFVPSDAVRDRLVTLYLDRVPIQDAIQALVNAHHLKIESPRRDLYIVKESDEPKVKTVTRVFLLKYARVVPSAGEVFPIFGLTGSLIQQTLTSETSTGTTGTGGGTTGLGTGSGLTGLGTGGIGGIGGLGAGQAGGKERGTGIVGIVQSLLTEHGSVVADPRTNSIIVTDIPERLAVIEETIAKLDVKPKQIFIEAEVVEVTLDTLKRIGLEYGDSTGQLLRYQGPGRTTFFPFSRGLLDNATPTHTMGTFSLQDAQVILKLLATERDVKFLARPRLLTLSGEVAEVRIVAEPVTGVTSSAQQQTGVITQEPERTTVGTILRVTPIVNEDRYITMVIEPEVSRVIVSNFNASFQDPNRRLARTSVMVPDGTTTMIAGLISKDDSRSTRRVPGLGDIPMLGSFFKRDEHEREHTEILLFITPHIVPEDAEKWPKEMKAYEREQVPILAEEGQKSDKASTHFSKWQAMEEAIASFKR